MSACEYEQWAQYCDPSIARPIFDVDNGNTVLLSSPNGDNMSVSVQRILGHRDHGFTALVDTPLGPAVLKTESPLDPDSQVQNEVAVLMRLAEAGVTGVPQVAFSGVAKASPTSASEYPCVCLQPVGYQSLCALIEAQDGISEQETCRVGAQIMAILKQVWAAGVTVVDIAPSNIIQMSDGSYQLIDFGSAHMHDQEVPINPLQQNLFRPIRHCPMQSRYQRVECVKPLLKPAYDLEALLYSLIFCVRGGRLPWSDLDDYATCTAKSHSRKCPRFLCGGLEPIYQQFAEWVGRLDIESDQAPDDIDAWIERLLEFAAKPQQSAQ